MLLPLSFMHGGGRMAKYNSKTALQLTGSDIRTMTRAELARTVSTIASAANKRITRLENAGQPITDTHPRFSVAGKSRAELMREFSRVKNFMNSPQASLSGQNRVRNEVSERLAKEYNPRETAETETEYEKRIKRYQKEELKDIFSDKEKYDKFWRSYERAKESNPIIANKQYKYRVLREQKQVMQENPNYTPEQIANAVNERMESVYKAVQNILNSDIPEDGFTRK